MTFVFLVETTQSIFCDLRVSRGQMWYNELTGELLSPRTPPKTEGLSAISVFQVYRSCGSNVSTQRLCARI